ncbi:MAG: hypothetical protein V3R16_09575 [Nitrospirales bacterium]
MTLHIDEVTPGQIQLVKDLLIGALARNRKEKGSMTRAQVRDAWQWIEWLGGPGERL